jgi:molybdopterin synthase catalytic subunit
MTTETTLKSKYFIQGPVQPESISASVSSHSRKKKLGAHTIFLGQVRNDVVEDTTIAAIEYSAYTEMADEVFYRIKEEAIEKFSLSCLHITHSLGEVKAGEISLMVFLSAPHRTKVFEALDWVVAGIKAHVPIWKKEVFENGGNRWIE